MFLPNSHQKNEFDDFVSPPCKVIAAGTCALSCTRVPGADMRCLKILRCMGFLRLRESCCLRAVSIFACSASVSMINSPRPLACNKAACSCPCVNGGTRRLRHTKSNVCPCGRLMAIACASRNGCCSRQTRVPHLVANWDVKFS